MRFRVRVREVSGLTHERVCEAANQASLLASLRREQVLVLSIAPLYEEQTATSSLPLWHPARFRPMSAFEVEMGLRQVASMLRSGVTLLTALQTVEEQAERLRAKLCWQRVQACIRRGTSLAEALALQPHHFNQVVVRLSEVGERAGELEHALSRAAEQLKARRRLRATVIQALVYPVIAVVMALGVSVYLVTVVIPKISQFLLAGGVKLPALTQCLMDLSAWTRHYGLGVLLGLVGVAGGWFLLRLQAWGREGEDRLLLALPVVGKILRLSGTALLARSVQIMTESGVTLVDSLTTATELMTNRRLRRRVREARESILQGQSLAAALQNAREFMPMLRRMAAVGEVSGSLPETFGETARFHEMLLALTVKRLGMLIEPVMICVTGGIVGFVYLAFFVALFAIAGAG